MNAPLAAPPVAHGTPEALREFIGECAAMARISAELAETYAAIGDDVGLSYQLRRLVAYTRAAVSTMADLRATKGAEP